MIIRSIDINGDWTFGQGLGNYKTQNNAIAQLVNTNLLSFLNDCFFAINDGIDWFNLLGAKSQTALNLAVSAQILNTSGITSLNQVSINVDRSTRGCTIIYNANTIYSTVSGTVTV